MSSRNCAIAIFGFALAVVVSSAARAAIINVPGDWPTIQLAINNSQPNDEIVIADGTYIGSFDTFGQPLTIRSASGDASTVTIVGDDSWTVFVASFETVAIQNVTIKNPGAKGIFIHSNSTVNLEGCHLTLMNGPNATEGAMIHLRGGSTLSAVNCVFDNSTNVGSGGAIGITNGASASITGCTFNNISTTSTSNDGGGIYVSSSSSITLLQNCTFTNLSASETFGEAFGGAIYYWGNQPLTISDSTFVLNSAYRRGGAIWSGSPLTVIGCEFRQNLTIEGTADGGAIYAASTLTVLGSQFRENTTPDAGGAIYCPNSYTITDSAFLCNVAAQGGALYLGNVTAPETIDNCFFALNEADGGGAILSNNAANSGPGISNTTFCGNHIGQIKNGWVDQGANIITVTCLATPPIDCDYPWPFPSFACTGDITADGEVSVTDLLVMIGAWGDPNLTVDLNRDATVETADLLLLLGNWGSCD